ncbi:hypothetical protein HDU76_006672 [Blyttiomyces sp. JEL0837]|nr:hypothetical protein HDU76_006672 [Blyttiomyces sp. JEL0837]
MHFTNTITALLLTTTALITTSVTAFSDKTYSTNFPLTSFDSTSCQNDVTSFANDVNSCVPNSVTASGVYLNLNTLTPDQIKCLCNGKVANDVNSALNDCQDYPKVLELAKEFKQDLTQCPKNSNAVLGASNSVVGVVAVVAGAIAMAL